MPEGGAFGVEHQGQVLGLPLPEHLEEHGGHPEGGVGGHPPGVGQGRQGVEGPVKIGADVDEVEDAGEVSITGILFPLIAAPTPGVNEKGGAGGDSGHPPRRRLQFLKLSA